MTIKQISVFLENRPGQLAEFTEVMEEHHLNMRALSLAEAEDFGVLRIIVDDPYNTSRILKEDGYVLQVTPVLAAEVPDTPGSLVRLLKVLGDAGINLNYSYAFTARKKDAAYMILRVDDVEKGEEALVNAGIKLISEEDFSDT